MPRLNKCKYRKKRPGFIEPNYRGKGFHISYRKWFMCQLLKDENPDAERHTQIECEGWNCGRYEEEAD